MRKRWARRLLKILLAFAALLAVWLLFERVRGQISLARYKQKLIAQGEKLSPKDFVQSFSEADNGAPEAIALIESLKDGVLLPRSYPPAMKLVPSGRAVVGFRESEWVESGAYRNGEWVSGTVTNHWDELAADLKANEPTLAAIRAALEKPVLNNHVDLAQGMKLPLSHLVPPKQLTYWLGAGSRLALHEGKPREARDYLVTEIRLPRLLAEDRLAISELVRIAIAGIAKADTWEALQADGWSDDGLAALQAAWASQEFAGAMARALEGERVFIDISAQMVRRSNQDACDALFGLAGFPDLDDSEGLGKWAWERMTRNIPFGEAVANFLKKQVYCRVWRFAWSHQDQRRALAQLQDLITLMRDAARQPSYADALPKIEQFQEAIRNRNFYDRLRFPSAEQSLRVLAGVVKRAMRAETDRSLTLGAIALKRYELRHGQPPETLAALVPEFLPAVPVDYMDGKPLKYRRNANGGFVLYSVGENGKDDGGDTTLPPDKTHLRNVWFRQDVVWPAPALPEEVAAWRKEAAKD
jgi:hypothetical protein